MKRALTIFILILILSKGYSQNIINNFDKLYPLKFKDNIELKGFTIQQTYKLDENNFILIGQKYVEITDDNLYDMGYKLIHLKRDSIYFKIHFESNGAGESYVYRPTFYKSSNDSIIILCNSATEFDCGISCYSYFEGKVKDIGFINASAKINNIDYEQSLVPFLKIYESNSEIIFELIKTEIANKIKVEDLGVYLYPVNSEEKIVEIDKVKFVCPNGGKIKIIEMK